MRCRYRYAGRLSSYSIHFENCCAVEGLLEEHDLLVGAQRIERMDGHQLRCELQRLSHFLLGGRDARVELPRLPAVEWGRKTHLVPLGRVELRVLGDHAVQHGGPGARQTADHQRRADLLLGDLGVALEPVLYARPRHEDAHRALALGRAADLVEVRLLVERAQQAHQGLVESGAEVIQPAALARLGENRIGIQGRGQVALLCSRAAPA
jgi:hypothetical protein